MSDDEHEDMDDEDELYDEEDGEIDDIDVADDNDNQKECLNWLLKEGGKSRYSGSGYRGSITDFLPRSTLTNQTIFSSISFGYLICLANSPLERVRTLRGPQSPR
jgi:hypothetical protein